MRKGKEPGYDCIEIWPPSRIQREGRGFLLSSVQDSWFEDDEFKHVIQKNHTNNNDTSVYCLLCCKSVSIEHQGRADLKRHMNGESH